MSTPIPLISAGATGAVLVTTINDRIRRINEALSAPAAAATTEPPIVYGTHAQRVNRRVLADATVYIETDRNGLTYQVQQRVWTYVSGVYSQTQSQLAALAATLTTNDKGLLVDVTDFAHVLRWTGSGWQYNDPSDPAGKISGFLVDPSPSTGWHLCDGSAAVQYLKSDGSVGTQKLPDLVSTSGNAAYLKFGTPAAATVNAAVAPTLTMNSYTPAGTITAPALSMDSYTPVGSVASTFFGSPLGAHSHDTPIGKDGSFNLYALNITGAGGSYTAVAKATGASNSTTIAAQETSSNSAGTPAGSVLSTFTGTPATLTGTVTAPIFTGTAHVLTGTISTTAEPQNVVLRPWFRC